MEKSESETRSDSDGTLKVLLGITEFYKESDVS